MILNLRFSIFVFPNATSKKHEITQHEYANNQNHTRLADLPKTIQCSNSINRSNKVFRELSHTAKAGANLGCVYE